MEIKRLEEEIRGEKVIFQNCECCGGHYAVGKNYGWYSGIFSKDTITKGLCESCNPNDKSSWEGSWYNPKLKCHSKDK